MSDLNRAADMLTAYGELIRRDGADHIDEHHYLPEVESIAAMLRERAAAEPAPFIPDDEQPTAPQADAPSDMHSCHQWCDRPWCDRPWCVAARQADALDAARVPLTDDECARLFNAWNYAPDAHDFYRLKPDEQVTEAFMQGIRAAELSHGIGAAALAPQEKQP